jgi:hypothetical protein
LRSSFHYDNLEKPLQVVRRGVKLPINYLDWSAVDGEASQHALERFLAEDRARGFDLANAPLMRLTVIELAPERRYIVFSLHHLLLDGWSSSLVYKEAAAIYDALCRGLHLELPTPRPFADYIEWLQSQDLSKAELYWRSRLAGYQGQSPLGRRGTSADGYHEHEFDVGECQTVVERGVLDALRQVARRSRITLNTVIQGAWALVLNAYLGQEDVVFGATVSGRPAELEHVESMVGLFINTLPVRVNVQPDTQLITWLQELHRQESESRQFDYTPLADIQGWCGRLSRGPLFETLLAFENFPAAAAAPQPDGAQGTRAFGKTNYPLNIAIVPTEDLWLKVMYSRSRFDRETIGC